ncbi:JAB domain-containing protein [Sphingomonas sp. RS2018]
MLSPPPAQVVHRTIDGTAAARALFAHLSCERIEVAGIAYLDGHHGLLCLRHVPGGADHVALSVRRVVRDALSLDARGVILAHNHPSGDITPSPADLAHTRLLAQALEAVGVRMLDALILSGKGTGSFRAMGLL